MEKMLLSNHDTLPSELHLAFEQVTLDYFEVWYNCIVIIMRKEIKFIREVFADEKCDTHRRLV